MSKVAPHLRTWTKDASGKRVRLPVDDNKGLCPKYRAISMGRLITEGHHLFYHPENFPTAESPSRCAHCDRRRRLPSDRASRAGRGR